MTMAATTTSKSPWLSYGLPPVMLAKARLRLQQLLMVFLSLSVVGIVLTVVLRGDGLGGKQSVAVFSHVCGIVFSGSLLLLSRRPSLSHELVLNLGLLFEVLMAAVISLTTPVLTYEVFGTVPPLTWVAPHVLLFTLMVPGPPRRMLFATVCACAAPPLGVLLLASTNHVDVTRTQFIVVCVSHGFIVPLAYVGSRIVHSMSTQIAEASQVGSYKLISKIGEGGMGEVWRGEHETLARPAAIKLIRTENVKGASRPDDVALQRFEREAQVTAALESFNTVNVYDYGTTDDGQVYYVMELLRGIDLDRLVDEFEPLPPERAVFFLKQICESLEEAHKAGVTHRDIKPANILACRYAGRVDVIKVLDFGLASLRKRDDPSLHLTNQDSVIGTPSYMPPEQIKDHDAVSPQSDIYCLGCVGYWLVTGKPLFGGSSAVEVLAAHLHETPSPPSELREGIPAELDDVIMRCLAKKPDERPNGASAVRDLLDRVPSDGWRQTDAKSWWDQNRERLW